MADVVIVGYLFTFLLINACSAGLTSLYNLEHDGSPTTQASDNRLPDDAITADKMMVHIPYRRRRQHENRFQCYQCDSPDCQEGDDPPTLCRDALSCYKATVRTSDGALRHSRGCSADNVRYHHHFTCHVIQPTSFRKRDGGGRQLNITCCQGDKCNSGEFPSLPAPDTTVQIKLEDKKQESTTQITNTKHETTNNFRNDAHSNILTQEIQTVSANLTNEFSKHIDTPPTEQTNINQTIAELNGRIETLETENSKIRSEQQYVTENVTKTKQQEDVKKKLVI